MRALMLVALLALAGCAPTMTGEDWRAWERQTISNGNLRTDRDPVDAPYTNRDLLRHFDLIAFGVEPDINDGRTRLDRVERWEEPIRWWLFANGAEQGAARREVNETFARIATATGLDIAEASSADISNIDIWFLGPDDYDPAKSWARQVLGAEEEDLIESFRTFGNIPCMGRILTRSVPGEGGPAGAHLYALILIRTGFSDLFRLSCIEEELVQATGLGNDDDSVRPSIFNDDEEFALLTRHDEWLLRLLYHPRLQAGMPYERAILVAQEALEEMRPGQ
ncbi:MAG: DUF2927 domain-containing protein [Pseudomonadota bacterium]